MNSTMISLSGCSCSSFSTRHINCVGARCMAGMTRRSALEGTFCAARSMQYCSNATCPPYVPPAYLMSTALSTRDSAVSAKQCSFQYMEL